MKKAGVFIILAFVFNFSLWSAPQLQAYLSYSTFFKPDGGPYVETYLLFNSKSCVFKKESNGKFHANVSATIIVKKDSVIQDFKKYIVSSPILDDTNSLFGNFIDIQRFVLPNGKYQFEIKLFDNNNSINPIKSKINIVINFMDKSVNISDIQLVDSYIEAKEQSIISKSGYDIVPHVLGYYPGTEKKLKFYTEIYNNNYDTLMRLNNAGFIDVKFAHSDLTNINSANNVSLNKTATIYFTYNNNVFDRNIKLNITRDNIEKLNQVEQIFKKGAKIKNIDLSVWSSPEGNNAINETLSKNRIEAVKKYINTLYGFSQKQLYEPLNKDINIEKLYNNIFHFKIKGKDKQGFVSAVNASKLEHKDEIIKIFTSQIPLSERQRILKQIGVNYEDVELLLEPLRRIVVTINFVNTEKAVAQNDKKTSSVSDSVINIEELLSSAEKLIDNKEKLKIYNTIKLYQPDNWKAFNNAGCVYFKLNNLDEAILDFNKANSLSQGNDIVLNNLKAVEHYRKVNHHKMMIKYYIESYENHIPLNDFVRSKMQPVKPVNVLLSEFDIEQLPAGNYNLVVEARNNENKLIISCKLFFQRSNPEYKIKHIDISNINIDNTFAGKITDNSLMNEFLDALNPISSNLDNEFIRKQLLKSDIKAKQQYFYNFWLDRNHENPEQAWLNYYEELKKVNTSFKCSNRKGYETDRGRAYLQYGAPNTIYTNENEPSAYPYEIWQYYSIKNQTNARFIFYLRDLVSNCYELLHSTVEGEIHNAQWQIVLYGRDTYPNSIDEEKPTDHWGSKADDYFKTPR